ncbi:MAG: hypothetical protein UV25_C0044G0007 [candidate division WWE3 bacterium GW2011_GWB1_42_41]|nr:MAG: hypothetical protein UV25_C0044G0007 [candidate division WWE3 bacterium GW2011_GWB1_42_41]
MEQDINNQTVKTYWGRMVDGLIDYYHKIPEGQKKFIRRGLLISLALYSSLFTWANLTEPEVSGVTVGAELSFNLSPSQIDVTNGPQNIEIKVTSSTQVSFIHLELVFDKSKVNVSSTPEITGPLTRIITVTSSSMANSTGRLQVVLALDPAYRNSPPSGGFSIANIPFKSVTSEENVTTNITIDDSVSTVVKATGSKTLFSLYGTTVTINQTSSTEPLVPPVPSEPPVIINTCSEYCVSKGYSRQIAVALSKKPVVTCLFFSNKPRQRIKKCRKLKMLI